MAVKFANNASTTLLTPINASQTNIQVVNPLIFPVLVSPDWFYATINQGSLMEIIKVTQTSGQTFTCVRGQDGTSGTAFPAGSLIELRVTRAAMTDIAAIPITKSITVEAPGAAENIGFFYAPYAITLTQAVASVLGTNPSVSWSVKYGPSRNDPGSVAVSGTTTSSSVVSASTKIPAGSFVWLETSAMSGTVLEFQLTTNHTRD